MESFPANCKGLFLLGPQIIGADITAEDIIKPNPNIGAIFTSNLADEALEGFLDDMAFNIQPKIRQKSKETFLQTDPAFRRYFGEATGLQE